MPSTIGPRTLDRWACKGFLTGYLIFLLRKKDKILASIDFSEVFFCCLFVVVFFLQQSLFQ